MAWAQAQALPPPTSPADAPYATASSPHTAQLPLEDPRVARARELFVRAGQLVREARWAEALGAFERSAQLYPHPITTYNRGACLRAMGQYTQAHELFLQALAENAIQPEPVMLTALQEDIHGFLVEIEHLLARVTLRLAPADARIAVDGRPLTVPSAASPKGVLIGGVEAPGPGRALPAGTAEVLLNPGPHVFTLSREGYADIVLNRTFPPSSATRLRLTLDRLPATLRIKADRPDALVTINKIDVGPTPVELTRPAGIYTIEVQKAGFVPYRSRLTVKPGQQADLDATLAERKRSIAERWWFWTVAGVLVAGAVVGTYAATRPPPERPPLDGGGLRWTLELPE